MARSVKKGPFIDDHLLRKVEFAQGSGDRKITCLSCHSMHDSDPNDQLAAKRSGNEACFQCHAEKRGPFIFEHAPVRESCLNCHNPHGSNHDMLLTSARPFLCQQCHTSRGHVNELQTRANLPGATSADVRMVNRGCQNCHTQIHGSNHPSGMRLHR